jgi:hypothetical protein
VRRPPRYFDGVLPEAAADFEDLFPAEIDEVEELEADGIDDVTTLRSQLQGHFPEPNPPAGRRGRNLPK